MEVEAELKVEVEVEWVVVAVEELGACEVSGMRGCEWRAGVAAA